MQASLKRALGALYVQDFDLLRASVNERTICARLATHLQTEFPKYDVDVEYNRHGMDPKTVEVDPEGDEKNVYPDLIVHRRCNDTSNLLVMEVKKSTNGSPRDGDRRKLECCLSKFGYTFAVLLDIPVGTDLSTECFRVGIERIQPSES